MSKSGIAGPLAALPSRHIAPTVFSGSLGSCAEAIAYVGYRTISVNCVGSPGR